MTTKKDSRSTLSDPYDASMNMLLGAMCGIPLDTMVDHADRASHSKVAACSQLPINGSPGYRERCGALHVVDLDGAAERVAVMQAWLTRKDLPDEDRGRVRWQVESIQQDIECARVWNAFGVAFGDPVDRLFRTATLPKGWRMQPSDHPMWSHLVDDRGRPRARMFYRSAFYDREAFIHFERRFQISRDYGDDRNLIRYVVRDGVNEVFATPVRTLVKPSDPSRSYFDALEAIEADLGAQCHAWLSARYPHYSDPAAHWDDP